MSLAHLQEDTSVEQERDSVGGSRLVESGIYDCEIEIAYLGVADSGANSLTIHLKTPDGASLRETLWITSGKEKGCKTYYEKDGKKQNLPGFSIANNMCLLTVGKPLAALDTAEKIVKVWDSQAKKELPKAVQAIVALSGQHVLAGIIKQVVDKTAKNDQGVYVPTGETREENTVDKFFRLRDGLTTTEIKNGATEAAFLNTWKDKWTGQTKNKASNAAGTGVTAGAPKAAAQSKSLFD